MKNFQLQEVGKGNHDIRERRLFKSDLHHELVSNKELSDILHVSPPSVSEMIMKLQKEGYVDYTAYKGSKMTRKGRREAGKLFRFHALWEVFLVEKLHFSWSEAHEQADGLELSLIHI